MKLLIAEDDKSSRIILEKVTRKWGYEPVSVEDGECAWELLQQQDPPELLLLDWEMPRLSGVELCKKIRDSEMGDPAFIILLTSRSTTQDIVTGLEAGSNEYISKPFNQTELQARLKVGKRMLELQAKRKKAVIDKARLQRELQHTRKMQALGQITGGIAHDFNNILGIIMGYINMSLDHYGDDVPEKMKNYLKTALQSSERAEELVKKMLVFTDVRDKESQQLRLTSKVEHHIEMLQSIMPETIKIVADCDDSLPPVILDPEQLQQLLELLCDNAKDAMNNQGVITIGANWRRDVDVECASCHKLLKGDWIELSVTDTGSGIEPHIVDKIFEPFFTTKDFGKGMGMAMVHGIISREGRHCLIETELGKGSKISALFPVQIDE